MKDFLDFKLLITPQLVKILYVLLQLGVLFYTWFFAAVFLYGQFSILGFMYPLFVFLIGSICVRIVCELLMVLFRRISTNQDEIKA